MNERKSLYDIKSFYNKKAILKASFQGMRYQVEQTTEQDEPRLRATVWPEPFCFERTAEEKKTIQLFPYTEEGLDEAYEWLCHQYDTQQERWKQALEEPYREALEGLG